MVESFDPAAEVVDSFLPIGQRRAIPRHEVNGGHSDPADVVLAIIGTGRIAGRRIGGTSRCQTCEYGQRPENAHKIAG